MERTQPFSCKRDGLTIVGMEYRPYGFTETGNYETILVSHGFTADYQCDFEFCKQLANAGYLVYNFSFCGGSRLDADPSVISEGKTTDMTIASEVSDLIAVKDYVKTKPYVNTRRLTLLGFSQGGLVSGLTAAQCKEELHALILIFPALCIPDDAKAGRLGGSSYNPEHVPDTIVCPSTILGKAFYDGVVNLDVYQELAAYNGPVLLFHGIDDPIVHYSYSVSLSQAYQKEQCEFHLIPHAVHGFDEAQTKHVLCNIREYLSRLS